MTVIQGDCLEVMRSMEDNSIDFVVTDPPYGLHFMGKDWDGRIPGIEIWAEALRVCKPGAMLAAFGGSRTHHHLMCAIEGGGWEIRDCMMWIYGSGFPKNHDIGKSIDKDNGKKRNVIKFCKCFDELCKINNFTNLQIDEYLGLSSKGATSSHYRSWQNEQPRFPTKELYYKLKKIIPIPNEFDEIIEEAEREIIDIEMRNHSPSGIVSCGRKNYLKERKITSPSLELAKVFSGYGTALKPAYEPIILAMKPCDGTFAQNAEKWGLAGINIDESRIQTNEDLTRECLGHASSVNEGYKRPYHENAEKKIYGSTNGRWPANLILDEESSEQLGEKSRFFYCAKASTKERGVDNKHPTVKPISLMRYIIKLLAPPNDPLLLDPFCGSGSTLIAAKELGIRSIGIELNPEYCEIAKKRIAI